MDLLEAAHLSFFVAAAFFPGVAIIAAFGNLVEHRGKTRSKLLVAGEGVSMAFAFMLLMGSIGTVGTAIFGPPDTPPLQKPFSER